MKKEVGYHNTLTYQHPWKDVLAFLLATNLDLQGNIIE